MATAPIYSSHKDILVRRHNGIATPMRQGVTVAIHIDGTILYEGPDEEAALRACTEADQAAGREVTSCTTYTPQSGSGDYDAESINSLLHNPGAAAFEARSQIEDANSPVPEDPRVTEPPANQRRHGGNSQSASTDARADNLLNQLTPPANTP